VIFTQEKNSLLVRGRFPLPSLQTCFAMGSSRNIPMDKVNLRLILVSGKTREFLFSPEDSAFEIAQYVFDNWPEGLFLFIFKVIHFWVVLLNEVFWFTRMERRRCSKSRNSTLDLPGKISTWKCDIRSSGLTAWSYLSDASGSKRNFTWTKFSRSTAKKQKWA